MAKPVILAVDDDPEVLRAVARDLRNRYAENYRIMRASSGQEALDALHELRLADEPVALLVVDQRMPDMTGVEFLTGAIEHYPSVRRVLLTAYADTDAAIRAINDVHIDYYLVKPWDPPEERLYPVLDDLLEGWASSYRPAFDGVRLVGHRWSSESHRARDFLARNQVPYQWYDLGKDPEAEELMRIAGAQPTSLPLLLLPDGSVLESPSNETIADKLGMRTLAELPLYDLVVVGAGPAGLAAAVYGASEGLKTALVEARAAGGQAGSSSLIENYLGFPAGLSGSELARRALTQAKRFGTEFLLTSEVNSLELRGGSTTLALSNGMSLSALSVIIATGVKYRRLAVPGCEELTGRGVYYGASSSEAQAVANEDVYIVGGANSAGQAAVHFAKFARSVTLLIRGTSLSATMSRYLVDRIEQTGNIKVDCHTEVEQALGESHLEALILRHFDVNESVKVPASTLFIYIGAAPPTEWLASTLQCDAHGFILTGRDLLIDGKRPPGWKLDRDPFLLETSAPGVFAAGDVRHGSGKRVAAAVGEGSMAVMSVWQYRDSIGL
jgi:thioredoxin reductase (NADPH)